MSEDKGNECCSQDETMNENIVMDVGPSNVSRRNYNRSASMELKEIDQSNMSRCEIIAETQHIDSVESQSEIPPIDIALAIENMHRIICENQVLVERYFDSFERNIGTLPSLQYLRNVQPSNELLHKETSSESSSDELAKDTRDTSKIKKTSKIAESPRALLDICTPSTSKGTRIALSSTCSDDASACSSANERNSGKSYSSSNCPGTLSLQRFPLDSIYINNVFFYSSITRRIRELYDKLFALDKFRYASLISVNAYKHTLSIKYITLPISRFLVEDLLDFVDFLTGTDVELREQNSNVGLEERQLSFVRENFAMGVQQHECRPFAFFAKEIDNFIWEVPLPIEHDSNPVEIVAIQFLRFYGIDIKTEKPDFETESRSSHSSKLSNESYGDVPEKCRLRKLDPKIRQLTGRCITDRLQYLNEAIRRSVMRCISDTRMILDFCIESSLHRSDLRLKSYLSGVKCMLNRLFVLREDCVLLLQECIDPVNEAKEMEILKVKVQIAIVLLELLSKLLEINTEFLGTVYI